MISKTLFTVIGAFLVLAGLIPSCEGMCQPDCTGKTDGQRVPDPNNCHYYYICLDDGTGTIQPTPVSFPCPDGEDFDSTTNVCKNPGSSSFQCDHSCFNCAYYCSEKNLLADPWQCGLYYYCVDNVPTQAMSCPPEKPYFNGDSCQTEQSRCCSCISYCSAADLGRLVADVKDCEKFYYCNKVGPAEELFHTKCQTGYFDFMHQRCSETIQCFAPCQEGLN